MHRPKGRFYQSHYMDTIKDFWGDNWMVSEVKPPNTKHPTVYFGRKQGIRGGQRVIITRDLAAYIATRTYTESVSSLPIGANTLKRIQRAQPTLANCWGLVKQLSPNGAER